MIEKITKISPSNFSFVMATGTLSLIFYQSGWIPLFYLFLGICASGYFLLVSLFIARTLLLKKNIIVDFQNIQTMFRYLTFCAGSNSLAIALCFSGNYFSSAIIGAIGIISTLLFTYILFCTLFFHTRASIQEISPFWLLLAIAYNYSGIIITTFWEKELVTNEIFLLLAFCLWSFAIFIYISLMTLNIYRMIFFTFTGPDMDPCYWTCMGAAAIAVVDGSQFLLVNNPPLFIFSIKPFMEGIILFLWAWGTAWIPILCLMQIWKRAYFKTPFRYQPSLWALVFPFGMYTQATHLIGSNMHLGALQAMVPYLLWLDFFLWCLVAWMSRLNPFHRGDLTQHLPSQNAITRPPK